MAAIRPRDGDSSLHRVEEGTAPGDEATGGRDGKGPHDDVLTLPGGDVLRRQDLAALPVLRALLVERNVTRAGAAVGLSQPATSAVLARLRRRFGDELLVRVGREFQLTPRATGVLARLEEAVEALGRLFGEEFEPATSTRTFAIYLSDYLVVVLAQELTAILADEAPNVTLDLRQLTSTLREEPDACLRHSDGMVVPREVVQSYPGAVLLQDQWVCIVAASNPRVGAELTAADLADLPWVTQYARVDPPTMPALRQLRALGIDPNVEVMVDGFQSVPFLVAGSTRVAFVQERLARRFAPMLDLRVLPSPVPVGPLTLALRWHPSVTEDPGHRWFRDVLVRAAGRVR